MTTEMKLFEEGKKRAIELMHGCSSPHGFLASPTEESNYQRVWGRDGAILGLAALLTEDQDLVETTRRTLQTLADHQGPHGEIPSNVDPDTKRVSYGGMAGRVDADLWFLIACYEYWDYTGDREFIRSMLPVIEKVIFLLGGWEFNNRGLLYIPQTGDWADEYLHHGYVLFDQALYLQAKRSLGNIHHYFHGSTDHGLQESIGKLKSLIRANYWVEEGQEMPEEVYHEVMYKKAIQAVCHCKGKYWLSYFSPHGYGYRFDSFANVLVSLLGIAEERQSNRVDDYIQKEIHNDHIRLVPAFYPVITPIDDEDWEDLKMTFSYKFKNHPYEYHNGGLWPMITGFYVADMARRGCRDQAREYLLGIHQANQMSMNGQPWSFPEYVHGKESTPGGTQYQGWSAAGAVIGHYTLEGKQLFHT